MSPRVSQAISHLAKSDPRLSYYIDKYPTPSFEPHENYYQELVESIISQQLSVKAAATILGRFIDIFGHFPTPVEILACPTDNLRGAGLSGQKVSYIQDLATKVIDGTVTFDHLSSLNNDEIIEELTAVKGIGVWTVHMFLMFCMGRLDVLAVGDLGVRTAAMKTYELDQLPSPQEIEAISTQFNWHPYESVACWYLWKSLDNTPNIT